MLKNQAESFFYSYEWTIKENRDLIPEEQKERLEKKKQQLAATLENSDPTMEQITFGRRILEEFREMLLAVGSDVYNQTDRGVDPELETVIGMSEESEEFNIEHRASSGE